MARTWTKCVGGLSNCAATPRFGSDRGPRGYRCYATYTYTRDYDIEWLYQDYDQALKHSGLNESDILFWVYGGNDDVQKICRERGWLWSAAHQQAYHHNLR